MPDQEKNNGATKELEELRLRYKAAFTRYLSCVHELADAAHRGARPSPEVLGVEEQTFHELAFIRQALLDALQEHSRAEAEKLN